MKKPVLKNSNILDISVKNYGECGWCCDKDNTVILKVSWEIWSQWLYLSQEMGKKEWGTVFWVEDNTITEFKIPKQEVNSVECEFKEELGGNGMVHSHHDMGAFHSSQDDQHERNLYEYSIVVSSTGYVATKKIKLPCNGFGYVKVELQLIDCPQMDLENITVKESEILATSKSHFGHLDFSDDGLPCEACGNIHCKDYECIDASNRHIPPEGFLRDEFLEDQSLY